VKCTEGESLFPEQAMAEENNTPAFRSQISRWRAPKRARNTSHWNRTSGYGVLELAVTLWEPLVDLEEQRFHNGGNPFFKMHRKNR
jgi:hypothetical protein